MQRNFSLDCFRALAIMLVFTGHSVNSFGSPAYLYPLQFGGTGVDLFFVLSGWLIGIQLFNEKSTFGDIHIYRFWVRRWMRTMPAYYAVLGATILQQYLTKNDFVFPWAHLFFIQNYQSDLNLFYISWSLALEEQFYLLIAPLTVVVLKLPKATQGLILFLLLLCPSLFRYGELQISMIETHVRLDCCAMGVLLAYIKVNSVYVWRRIRAICRYLFPVSFAMYFFFFVAWYNAAWSVPEPSKLFLGFLFGVWIVWSDTSRVNPKGLTQKLVMHISTRSYAMYLLHVDALVVTKKLIGQHPNFVEFYGTALIITLFASEVLHRSIEIPIMKARRHLSIARSRKEIELSSNRVSEVAK